MTFYCAECYAPVEATETLCEHLASVLTTEPSPAEEPTVPERKLSQKQRDFTRAVGRLIEFAYESNVELTFGDAYRDHRVFGHFDEGDNYSSKRSLHKIRLAVDFNVFIDDVYRTDAVVYAQLGYFWLALDPDARWGGQDGGSDANHFSFTHYNMTY